MVENKISRSFSYDSQIRSIISDNPEITYSSLAKQVGKSITFVRSRVFDMGLRSATTHAETKSRIVEYKKAHPFVTNFEIAQHVGCSNLTVSKALEKAGLKRKREEVDRNFIAKKLQENPNITSREIAKELGCSKYSVIYEKRRLQKKPSNKVFYPSRPISWEEVSSLLDKQPDITVTAIARELQTSISSIRKILWQHGIKTSTKNKIDKERLVEELRKNPDISYVELGKMFGCSKQAVYELCSRMGLARERHQISGIPESEMLSCIQNNPDKTYNEIAEILNVNECVIRRCALKAGISRAANTREKIKQLLDYAKENPNLMICEYADKFGLSDCFVSDLLAKHGLREKIVSHIDKKGLIKAIKKEPDRSRASLANEFHCSESTVSKVRKQLKYPKKTKTKKTTYPRIQWGEIEKALDENPTISVVALAENFGIAVSTVSRFLRKNNRKRGHLKKVSDEDVQALLDKGTPVKEIASAFGVCVNTIRNSIERMERNGVHS